MIRSPRRRLSRSRLVLFAVSLLLVASVASAAPTFKLADDSTVVVRGLVDDVRSYKQDAFLVFTVTPNEVLKGTVEKSVPLKVVEERVFGSERPYFAKGAETLVFAVPQYLATKDDTRARAYLLASLLASPVPRLRGDALDAIGQHHELAAALDAPTLAPVATVLADDHVPVAERATMLVGLAQAGATGVPALATEVVKTRGPLQAAGVEALLIAGQLPREEQCARTDAADILREQREAHPDERVRQVIKLALGEHVEEHDQ